MGLRMVSAVCVTLLVLLLAGCPPNSPPTPSREYDPELLGVWTGTFYEPNSEETYTVDLEFTEENFEIRWRRFDSVLWAGTWGVHLDTTPKQIDLFVEHAADEYGIVHSVEQVYLGYYELSEDTIRFSLGEMDGPRPETFEDGVYMFECEWCAPPADTVEGEVYY